MNNKPLKKLTNHDRIVLWGQMDDIVLKIKNKKIVNYWKKHGTPYNIKYEHLIVNRFLYHEYFDEYNFNNKSLQIFRHCINMCLDNDVQEYLNSLNTIKGNK